MPDTTMPAQRVDVPLFAFTAEERLVESRGRLRSALLQIAHPAKALPSGGSGWIYKIAGMLGSMPGAAPLIAIAKDWWHQHPLRHTAQVTGRASDSIMAPIVRLHPAATMAAATAAGAVLVLLEPWRLMRPRLLVGAASLLVSQSIRSTSTGLWLRALISLAGRSKTPR
jgi:hypothetical protein